MPDTEYQLLERKGSILIFWRVLVGGGLIAAAVAGANLFLNFGEVMGDVDENKSNISRNENGRLEMGREVQALQRANAASAATAMATEHRLDSIDERLKSIDNKIDRALQRRD